MFLPTHQRRLPRRTLLAAAGLGILAAAGCDSPKTPSDHVNLTYLTGLARSGRDEYVDVAIAKG